MSETKYLTELQHKFIEIYGKDNNNNNEIVYFFAPGRVNFIGDHIDYCGGKVLPAAIECGTYLAARVKSQPSDCISMHSVNNSDAQHIIEVTINNILYSDEYVWSNYPKGVLLEYANLGLELPSLELLYWGNMPIGSALSSSSSILLVTDLAMQHFCNYRHDDDDITNRKKSALLCHHSEVSFNKINCGTMDQAAVALGKKNQAMLLDCSDLSCQYITPNWGDYKLLIINSNKPRNLAETAYNERREQANKCTELAREWAEHESAPDNPLSNLCSIKAELHQELLEFIKGHPQGGELLHKRARHILSESNRVIQAATALTGENDGKKNILLFADLLNASQKSLRYDYEVTGPELDTLVDESMKHPGVIGARMTGGGFTGCTLTLVDKNSIASYKEHISKEYHKITGLECGFVDATPADGVRQLINNNNA